jgi:hypothetical protein
VKMYFCRLLQTNFGKVILKYAMPIYLYKNKTFLKKLMIPQIFKEFPAFYATCNFITVFETARQLSISRTTLIQIKMSHHIYLKSVLILLSHLRPDIPNDLVHSGFPIKTLYLLIFYPHVTHAPPISLSLILSSKQYFVRNTNRKAPQFAQFSSF